MKKHKLLIEKIVWSLAPLMWGSFVWFMAWGLGSILIPYSSISIQLNYLIRVIATYLVINFFFRSAFNKSLEDYQLSFFGYAISLPSWWLFMVLILLGVGISFTPLWQYEGVQSIILGVLISSIIEEFVTHSFFIKYKMDLAEFIVFNIISSFAFMIMHTFYVKEGVELLQLVTNGHFQFSFMLGIIVYKTQRIELSIILHMLSNLLRYTIPVCLLLCPWPSSVAIISSTFIEILFYLCLGGCSYYYKEKL